MQIRFPITKEDGKEFQDIDELRTLLKEETTGSYLLGKSNSWHGGIHITDKTAPWCRKTRPIRAIADGEVVAYRITKKYEEANYGGASYTFNNKFRYNAGNHHKYKFSNNFCLIKHKYKEVNPEDSSKCNEFTFYSLYMHLAPMEYYPNTTRYKLNSNRDVRDRDGGTNKMMAPKINLKKGTLFQKVKNSEAISATTPNDTTPLLWHKIEILSGSDSGKEKWIAWTEEKVDGKDIIEAVACKKPDWIDQDKIGSLHVPGEPKAIKAGDTVGFLGLHETIRSIVGGTDGKHQVHLEVFSNSDNDSDGNLLKVLNNDAEIKQGITYLKIPEKQPYYKKIPYQKARVIGFKRHSEPTLSSTDGIYTIDDGTTSYTGKIAFKKNEYLHADNGYDYANCMLIDSNDQISEENVWLAVTGFTLHDTSDAFMYEKSVGKNTKEIVLKSPNIVTDIKGGEWVEVEDGKFLKVEDSHKLTNHDWSKLGYSQVKSLGEITDRVLTEQSVPSPFFRKLVRTVDKAFGSQGQITKAVVRNSLEYQTNWEGVEKVIAKCQSEWCETESNDIINLQNNDNNDTAVESDVLDAHIEHEKTRAQSLEWISKVNPALGISNSLWHFHPLGFLGNLDDEMDLKWLTVPKGKLTFDSEGMDDSQPGIEIDDPLFTRKPHVPTNSSGNVIGGSGITIGRGFDVGQFETAQIEAIFTETERHTKPLPTTLRTWLKEGAGKKGSVAQSHFTTLATRIPNQADRMITRKQQHYLFLETYKRIRQDVQRITNENDATYGSANLDTLNPQLVDVIVDLRYRGDYHGLSRPYIQKSFVDNDYEAVKKAISAACLWVEKENTLTMGSAKPVFATLSSDGKIVPPVRYQRRALYLISNGENTSGNGTISDSLTYVTVSENYNTRYREWNTNKFTRELTLQKNYLRDVGHPVVETVTTVE